MRQQRSGARSRVTRIQNEEHARIRRLMDSLHVLRAKFKQLHDRGAAALKRGDYRGLGDAIRREGDLIRQHRILIERQQALVNRRIAGFQPK